MMTLIPYQLKLFLTVTSVEWTMMDKWILPDENAH